MLKVIAGLIAAVIAFNAAAEIRAPDVLVREVTEQLQAEIGKNQAAYKADADKLAALIDNSIVPHFDVPRISRLVLGVHGRSASPEQLERFGNAFKSMLFKSYANALVEYHDSVNIEWKPLNLAADATRATVQSTLIRADAAPVPIGFVLQKGDAGWKVFDITVENISLINNFRAQLNGDIARNGLDAVITRLEGGQLDPTTAISGGS